MVDPVFTRHADVRAVLADPRFVPPPPPPGGPAGTVAWLRASVARFSAGPAHSRRRALVDADLAGLDAPALRRSARAMAARFDPVSEAARQVPVCVLASALGLDGPAVVDAVAAVGPAYISHPPMVHPTVIAGADAAVARLVALLGPGSPEMLAARIGLLVQAYDATAALITNTLAATEGLPSSMATRWPVEALLLETLRYDPPVRVTRRLSTAALRVGGVEVAAGVVVLLDLAGANRDPAVFDEPDRFDPGRRYPGNLDPGNSDREFDSGHLTFGGPPRVCPGRDHALAIAAGVVEGLWAQ
jgi:cytochrome P450